MVPQAVTVPDLFPLLSHAVYVCWCRKADADGAIRRQPVSNSHQPVSDSHQPVSDSRQPVSDSHQPVSDSHQPVSDYLDGDEVFTNIPVSVNKKE